MNNPYVFCTITVAALLVSSFISYCLRFLLVPEQDVPEQERRWAWVPGGARVPLYLVIAAAPGIVFLICALASDSSLYVCASTLVLIGALLLAPLCARYSVGAPRPPNAKAKPTTKADSIKKAAPAIAGSAVIAGLPAFLFAIDIQPIKANNLVQLYSVALQSVLTLIGIVLAASIFVLDRKVKTPPDVLLRLLRGFLALFSMLSLISIVGLITARDDLNLTVAQLSMDDICSYNSRAAYVFLATVCILMLAVLYMITMFSVIRRTTSPPQASRDPSKREPNPSQQAGAPSKDRPNHPGTGP